MQNFTSVSAIAALKNDFGLTNGSTVYVKTATVAASGSSRTVSVFVPVALESGLVIRDISHLLASALYYPLTKHGTIRLRGCGLDVHQGLVKDLARLLELKLNKVTMYAINAK